MTTDFLLMLEEEVERISAELPSDEVLANISELAKRQVQLENLVTRLEELQNKTKESLKNISERSLPAAILEAGLTEFKLEDGTKVSVKKAYYPSVKEENKHEAFSWLVDNGYDIIKNEVKVSFTKGESAKAAEALAAIRGLGFQPVANESIHWQTFRAWAKEVMEKGIVIPESINVYVVDQASIKRSK